MSRDDESNKYLYFPIFLAALKSRSLKALEVKKYCV